MTLLLDTHAILWFWWDKPELSDAARTAICDPSNRKLVSPASCWEVAIKVGQKKLDLGGSLRGFFEQHLIRNNFEWLPIGLAHLELVADLPHHHKDPFDRLLIAQALFERISVVGTDTAFDAYGVPRIW